MAEPNLHPKAKINQKKTEPISTAFFSKRAKALSIWMLTEEFLGELAGVGCLVDSCQTCSQCAAGEEQYCENGSTATYNSKDKNGELTYGGYSTQIVADE